MFLRWDMNLSLYPILTSIATALMNKSDLIAFNLVLLTPKLSAKKTKNGFSKTDEKYFLFDLFFNF